MADESGASLASINILASLSKDGLDALAQRCSWRNYEVNEQIIDRQSDSRDVYFVVSGKTRVVNYSLSGREVTFDDLEAGSYFGEIAALDGEPRSANVVALEDTTVASLSPEGFRELVNDHPQIGWDVMHYMAAIIRTSTDRIMDLSTLGANNRVHAELLRLAKDGMNDDNTAAISPIPIHGDIASRVSTTRETVARVLGDLSRSKIVRRESDALVIVDLERLQSIIEQVRGE
jgi:CRP-like cAMP-binding protein